MGRMTCIGWVSPGWWDDLRLEDHCIAQVGQGLRRTPFHNQKALEKTRIFQKMGIGTGRGLSMVSPRPAGQPAEL